MSEQELIAAIAQHELDPLSIVAERPRETRPSGFPEGEQSVVVSPVAQAMIQAAHRAASR